MKAKGRGYYRWPIDAAVAVQAKSAASILEWANVRLPENQADADEPLDQFEPDGFSASEHDIPAELTECLGLACPKKSTICSVCQFSEEGEEESFSPHEIHKVISRSDRMPDVEAVFQSRHDAQYELYALTTTSRGGRLSAELRFSGRMSF